MPHKNNFFFFGCIIPENIKSMDTSLLSSYLLLLKYLEYLFINDPLIFKNLFLPIINNIIDPEYISIISNFVNGFFSNGKYFSSGCFLAFLLYK